MSTELDTSFFTNPQPEENVERPTSNIQRPMQKSNSTFGVCCLLSAGQAADMDSSTALGLT
jgi:hypothetical protein